MTCSLEKKKSSLENKFILSWILKSGTFVTQAHLQENIFTK